MPRYIEIALEKRRVRCVARLLEEEAPKTCNAVWRSLPLGGDVFHAKYASHEIFTLLPAFGKAGPGNENRTITPIPGDVMYFELPPGIRLPLDLARTGKNVVDLAVFYDRNNLLLSPSDGFTPGNVFGSVVRGLDEMKSAGYSVWREGPAGDRLTFRRLERADLKKWGLT
ncbi:MAG: DUF3830 family protein [Bryobacteraceae bacterium]|nr:DUF3830 family protein [Bryobacterales bacterium]MEB2362084.1 DUF3830 family protein [Bryobacterales bacterium]NUN02888.1 DUF3830 family protein [Bryobacteraceae bacterium]